MKLIDKIRKALETKESRIKFRGEISGANWAEVKMTNIIGEPITLGTPLDNIKIGIQTLVSGAVGFSQQNYRIDNSHGFLHQHSGASVSSIEGKTMSGALLALFGNNYKTLEN